MKTGDLFEVKGVDENSFKDIPDPCRYCMYWQTTGNYGEGTMKPEMEQEKRKWFGEVVRAFGNCLKVAYLSNVPIGFVQYAPAKFFPRVKEYTSEQPTEDSVFIACLYIVNKEARGKGFGTLMLKDLVAELEKRRFSAIETFARRSSTENPSGPSKLYLKHNFRTKNEKDDFPLVRLEL